MPGDLFKPHPISEMFLMRDSKTEKLRSYTFEDRYHAISQIRLNQSVPEDIVLSFETAKNLFLYGWFIYRFYSIADHQALNCLEYGLRKRFENEFPNKRAGLKVCLTHAINNGLLKNEGFQNLREMSRETFEKERLLKPPEEELQKFELNHSDLDYEQDKPKWDYLSFLLKILPQDQNMFAYDPSLTHSPSVLKFVIVGEILNQIYPETKEK